MKYDFMLRLQKIFWICAVCLLAEGVNHAQVTAQWRGPARDGIYPDKGLLRSWPDKGPELLWSVEELGNGYGSPAVTDKQVFINGEGDSTSTLFAFNLQGKLLWKATYGKEFTGSGFASRFPGARSTPTVAGDLVYVFSGTGTLACFESLTGRNKWTRNLAGEYQGACNAYGYAESPLVDGEVIYCSPGGPDAFVVAMNRFTGETLWASKSFGDTVSFTSPMLIQLPARKLLVSMSNHYIYALDAKSGDLLWKQYQDNVKLKQQCNTPVYDNGMIYYVAGDGNGAVKLQLSPDGSSVTEVWRNPLVKNNFKGFVKLGNSIYTGDKTQKVKRIDTSTGQVTDSLKIKDASLVYADGRMYCYSDNGEVTLLNVDGPKMEVAGKFKIDKGSQEYFAHPVIRGGILWIRHGKALLAYSIRQKQ